MRKIKGCALLCDEAGIITGILRDDIGFDKHDPRGKPLSSLTDAQSAHVILDMIHEAKNRSIAFDYRINVNINNNTHSLYFITVHLEDQLLVIGAENHEEAIEFTNHLQSINNEQTNNIRRLIKENETLRTRESIESSTMFDEITNLNNELVNLQRQLSKKNTELGRLNDLKNSFLGMAAHDLRNPLGTIDAYTELIREEAGSVLPERSKKFLNIISELTTYMLKLVQDFLDFSKIEKGQIKLELSEIDLHHLLQHQIELKNTTAEKKNVKVELESPVKNIKIKADKNKVEQVFNNLCNNAVKFSPRGGKVQVRIETGEKECRVSISDQGSGVHPSIKEGLFRPFQASLPGTEGEKGSGLGLYIVKKIVESHCGKVWYESEEGKGSTFYFTLPLELREDQVA